MKKLLLPFLLLPSLVVANEISLVLSCTDIADDTSRLDCYDAVGDYAKLLEKSGLAKKFSADDAKEIEKEIEKAFKDANKEIQK